MLNGKNVILAISASIAAYKAAEICRSLVKKGANVKVLMTPDSTNFITPLTLSTLSKNPVFVEYANAKTGEWSNHVKLAKWADFFLLAPATANTISKMANGICDNLLMATYLSMENKVFFAPAMDLDMYQHPTTKQNISKLESFGNVCIPAESGELASGLVGEGRMAEVENIIAAISTPLDFKNKKILITAGPTYEAIDPVRFIGNHSSGKMGFAIAEEANDRGAEVCLISGPVEIKSTISNRIDVTSAEEMFEAVKENYLNYDIIIMSAAVADYTPAIKQSSKLKKKTESLSVDLKPTIDILSYVGQNKTKEQCLVGFALETDNEEANALKKLEKKNLDFIVLNSLRNKGAGFKTDTNQISIFDKKKNKQEFALKEKSLVAKDVLNSILKF